MSRGYYKHIETEGATLGKLNNNYAYVFMNGGVYVPDARNLPELTAVDGNTLRLKAIDTILATTVNAGVALKLKHICG